MAGDSFFGGFATGAAKGVELGQNAEALDLKKQQFAQTQRIKALEFLKDFRPMLEQAVAIEDGKTRSNTLNDLFAGYTQHFGQVLDKDALKWAKDNPQQFAEMLKRTSEEGMRLDQVFPLMANPMLRGATMIALEKGARTREGQGALAGTGPTGGGASGTGGSPASGSPDAPTSVGPTLTGPTPAIEGQVQFLNGEVAKLDQRIATVAKAGNTQGVAVLEQMRRNLVDRISAMTEKPALGAAEDDRKLMDPKVAAELKLSPATTVGEFKALMAKRNSGTPIPAQAPTGLPRSTPPAAAPTTDAGVTRLPTAAEAKQTSEDIERRARVIPAAERTKEMVDKGITTFGAAEDAGIRLMDAQTQNVGHARATANEQVATKNLVEIQKKATEARDKRQQLEVIQNVFRAVGPTGALVGPLRENVLNTLQLFGVQSDKLSGIQTMDAASIQLVRATLKDFSGNDSDRDVLTALAGSPGKLKTADANQALLAVSLHQLARQEAHSVNANRWQGQFGSLAAKDPATGLTFNEAWDAHTKTTGPIITPELRKQLGLPAIFKPGK